MLSFQSNAPAKIRNGRTQNRQAKTLRSISELENKEQNKNLDNVFEEKVPRTKTAKTDKKAISHFFDLGHANIAYQEGIARLNIRNYARNF